ncbi:MAG: hypothetical protein QM655_09610 [Nocardioidaceae bacterium]
MSSTQPTVLGAAPTGDSPNAGAVSGLGTTEATRRKLSEGDIRGLVAAEVVSREMAAGEIEAGVRADAAHELSAEVAVLHEILEWS